MRLPKQLTVIRHGESEQNVARKKSTVGDNSCFTPEFLSRLGRNHRLTARGVRQILKTKATLQSLGHTQFDGYFVSPYIRTLETALHLGFEGVDWTPHRMLRERDDWLYGLHTDQQLDERFGIDRKYFLLDPIYWRTTQGESMADIELRLRLFFEEIAATSTVENVIVVAHSRVMWTLRMWFEHLSEEQIVARSNKSDGFSITNGHILQYRRKEDSVVYEQVRSIDPCERIAGDDAWIDIVPKRFSNLDLARQVEAFSRLFE